MKKRLISLVLAIAMVASTFPSSALAEEVESEQEPVPAVTETVPEEPAPEPEPETATEPPAEAATEPETEPVTEPATEPETEPETEPATEPVTEPAAVAATVTFICTPGELTLTVFPADTNEQSAIKPQADGTYLLLPGDYVYLAAAEGYESARGRFTLPEQTPTLMVEVTLTQSAPEQETETPTEEATEIPTEEPTEAPTEAPTEEPTAPVPSAIPVSFACTPAELTLVVFPADADETAAIDPQADGTYLLLPGDYAYLAAAEGYEPLEGSFTVPAEAEDFQIAVTLNVSTAEEEEKQLDEGILDSGTCGKNLTWELNNGVLEVTGTGTFFEYSYNNIPWKTYTRYIEEVIIGEGVTNVGAHVFQDCRNLTKVTLPSTLTRIEEYAFYFTAINEIKIPSGVNYIGTYALSNTKITSLVVPEGVTWIGCASNCSELSEVILPSTAKNISSYAFAGCTSLKAITIPSGVNYIDQRAFLDCTKLEVIIVPDGITELPWSVFEGCTNLKSIVLPKSLNTIRSEVFLGCINLSNVHFKGTGKEWNAVKKESGNQCLLDADNFDTHSSSLEAVSRKEPTFTADGNNAYWICATCGKVYKDADGSIETTVAAETLSKLPSIDNGTCGQSINWVLTEDGVMILSGSGAMENFAASGDAPWDAHRARITAVVIPVEITAIGSHAFDSCEHLTAVCYAGTAEQWENVQIGSGNASLTGAPVRYNTDHMCLLTEVPAKEPTYVEDGHNTYWICAICQKLYQDAQGTGETTAEAEAIPKLPSVAAGTCGENIIWALGKDGVMDVFGTGAMTSFTCVGNTTWEKVRPQIRSVVIAEGITKVAALGACTNLTSVTIPNGVTEIGRFAFYGCNNLVSVAIPDGVTSIGNQAFYSCGLTRVFISKTVTQIGLLVFDNCRELSDVYYFGSETDWAKIQIDSDNSGLFNATIHYDFTHVCTLTKVEAKPATETEDGCQEYWVCSTCGLAYKDALGKKKTTVEAETIPAGTIAYGNSGKNMNWILSGSGELTISGTGSGESFDGSNAPWYEYREHILSATIENGITSIGSYAFYGCDKLTTVTMADSVIQISPRAFLDCSSLTNVSIPDTVNYIGDSAFENCTNLTNVKLPSSITYVHWGSFRGCSKLVSVEIPESVLDIDDETFSGCSSLTNVKIPNKVTRIGMTTFSGCSNLTSITIPEGVTSIGSSAFSGCTNLTEINIPAGVTSIGWYAFKGCSSLTSITIPESVTSIGGEAFSGCTGLTNITIPGSVTSIDWNTFADCSSLTSITIPESVTSIGEGAFQGCSSLTEINIPAGVTSIGGGAFQGCSSLTSITIPESVTSIGGSAFSGCTNLTEINIPVGVPSIELFTFCDCSSLTSITIPEGVTSIGNSAFSGCSSLASISIPEGVTSIVDLAFMDCSSLVSISIPDSVTSIGFTAFYGCSSLTEINIPAGVTSINSNTFDGCSSLTSITIPESVTSIDYAAFRDCTSLTAIALPESVTSIGDEAFSDSGLTTIALPEGITVLERSVFRNCTELTSVTIPKSVTSIGERAFENCRSLVSLTIPESVTSIGNYAFANCGSLTDIAIPRGVTKIGTSTFSFCTQLSNVVLSDNITSIGTRAFDFCNQLTTVTIPQSVTSIGRYAFNGCRRLATVFYKGTEADWNSIRIDAGNLPLTGAEIRYISDHICELTEVPAKASTCTEEGNNRYWICSVCGKVYKDALGKVETTIEAETLPTKPAATTMAKVTGSEGSFTATWNAQKNVNGYAVQYATNSSFATCRTLMVYGARTTSKTVNGLAAGTYYVRVRTFKTVDSKKIYSLASPALTVTVGSTKPTSTTLTKVTAGDSSFTAAWNAQTNADGYALQYAADSSFASCKTVMVYGGDVASTTVKNLTAGTYYVRVRTFKTAGNSKAYSLASAAMTVTVGSTKPATTTLTKVTAGDGSFTAAWNAQTNADGYALQYAADSSFASCKTVMVYGGDVASTTVKNLAAGTYYVRVRTFKTVGNSKVYSLASAAMTVTVDSTKPVTTTLTKITGGDGSFTAAWNAKQNVDGYAVQYATDSSFASCKTVMVYGGDVASTTVKNLTAGTYYVRVRTFKTVDGAKNYSLASAYLTVTVK